MNRRTPTTHSRARSHLRVLDGGLSAGAPEQDELELAFDAFCLEAELAEAARLCDDLEHRGLRVTFDADPAGGRVRARVTGDPGRCGAALPLAAVVSPTQLRHLGG